MNEHILELLEFPKVCQMVSSRASSVVGRRRALSLRPTGDRQAIEEQLDLVRQMCAIWIAGLEPGPIEAVDLDPLLGRLRHEGHLFEPLDLVELGRFLDLSTRVRHALDRPEVAERFGGLHRIGQRFADFGGIVRRLGEVFDPSGEFLDTASPRLARIRRRLRESRVEASGLLEKLVRSESSHPEDAFVTLRDNRYVLAVRSSDRGRLPGIVHGHSKTGQTVFLEPMQAIEPNNAISSLEADEQEERVAILRELSRQVQERADEIAESYEASSDLDLIRAKARLALDLDATIPSFHEGEALRLVGARHPLLADSARGTGFRVVPLDIELTGEARTLVLSGPNMGGKTVALKTVGLVCAMAQAGLPVPAGEGTDLPLLDGIYVDLGDEQSIEQETSTFAGHLKNIALAWKAATNRSLVLLDELGGGTDPEEGTALGRALIELLTERGCLVLVTTHLIGLKMVAHEHPGMRNAAMEFDATTQRPTYRMTLGSPGRSRAFELARQILPPGDLTERAERYRTRWAARLDQLLGDLESKQAALETERRTLEEARHGLTEATNRKEEQAERLRERLRAIREARLEGEGRAIAEAERLLSEARRLREQAGRAASSCPPTRPSGLEEVEERVRAGGERHRRRRDRGRRPVSPQELQPGRTVWSHDLKSPVVIDAQPDPAGRIWIVHGTIRFHVPVSSLGPAADGEPPPKRGPSRDHVRGPAVVPAVPKEIDIRGKTAEEGLQEAERFIDRAALAGIPEIRIIHGKGTGTLKREIEAFLQASPLVESFRTAEPREGGWGATVVQVRSAQVGA